MEDTQKQDKLPPIKYTKRVGHLFEHVRDIDNLKEAIKDAARHKRKRKEVQKVLEDICRELAAGNIAADPFWRGPEKNACRYCDYAAACHFEEGRGEDRRRWLPSVGAQEFWAQVEKED